MRRTLLMVMVACLLIPTTQAFGAPAKEVQDVGSANFDELSWQWFDNRNHHPNVVGIPWVNTSKGDYFLLDAQIITGGLLSSFDNIIEVTAKPSDPAYASYTFPLIRYNPCNSMFGEPMKEFYLYLRYSPWMQASNWTYTLKYNGTDRKMHIQRFEKTGASYYTTPPINNVSLDRQTVSWPGIGFPDTLIGNYVAKYELRRYDGDGCLTDRWYLDSSYYDPSNGRLSVALDAYSPGTVLRLENRKNMPSYGLAAKSVYIFQVPPSAPGLGPLGFGTISGETGHIRAESSTSNPSFHVNQIDFGSGYNEAQLSLLTQRAEQLLGYTPGGSSAHSVAFSYEILNRAESAVLLKAGSDINYSDPSGNKTDYLISVVGTKLGVKVTRAFLYPPNTPYTVPQAQALLTSKLQDINLSTANVSPSDAWMKQILCVFAYDESYVAILGTAYDQIDASIKGNTIVYITRTDGAEGFMYGF